MAFFLALLLSMPPQNPPLLGEWTGYLTLGQRPHQVHMTVIESEFGTIGRLSFTDLGRRFITPVVCSDSVRLAIQTARFGYVEVAAALQGDRMMGVVTGSAPGSLALRRTDTRCEICEAATGEYVSGADTLMLTFRPRGGMLMAVSGPESISLGERFPVDGRLVRLGRSGEITEEMTFRRDAAGDIQSLERHADGHATEWDRVPNGVRQREVRFRSGDLQLTATLYEPTHRPPIAAVAAIQGSLGGRIATRENFWQLSFARGLVRRGIAVMVPDKRGSGDSEGEWTLATIEELADDAEAAVQALRDLLPGGTRVGLGALSEGGWVAPVVASRPDVVDFVVSVSGSALGGEENGAYEIEQLARQAGLGEEAVGDVVGLQALAAAYARSGDPNDWRRYLARRAQLIERPELAEAVGPFPTEPGHPRVVQYLHRWNFEPLPYWSHVQVPVFAVWGGRDIRVPGSLSYERLSALFERTGAAKNHELILYERSGHSIEDPETGRLSEKMLDRLLVWIERLP